MSEDRTDALAADERGDVRPSRRSLLAGAGVLGAGGLLGGWFVLGLDEEPANAHEAAMALVDPEDVTHRAVADGPWSDPETWDGGVPDEGARVRVPGDRRVTVDEDTARLATIRVDGELGVDPEATVEVGVETIVVTADGRLELGTAERPVTGEATVTFLDRGEVGGPPEGAPVERGLIAMGAVRAHGRSVSGRAATAEHPSEGDDELVLAEAPSDWREGDRIVLAGVTPDRNTDEERTVAAVDGRRVTLDRPLSFDHHPPREDLAVHVGHLDRSVRLRSESARTRHRGHVMFMTPDVQLRGLGAYDLGRTDKHWPFTNPTMGEPLPDAELNPKARYAIHFHRTGPTDERAVVEDCVVWDSPGWGFVNHGSNVAFEGCVSYDVHGAGFVTERGDEAGTFRHNLAVRSAGSGLRTSARRFDRDREPDPDRRRAFVDDFGHGGHGFWFQGADVVVEDNVAAGHRHHGFVYWNRAIVDEPVDPELLDSTRGQIPNFAAERLDHQPTLRHSDDVEDGEIPSSSVKMRSFSDNVAYASAGGLEVSRHRRGNAHQRREEFSVVDAFTCHSIGNFVDRNDRVRERHGGLGIRLEYATNLVVRDSLLLGSNRRGTGVERNQSVEGAVFEDTTITGWDVGVRTPTRGPGHLVGCHLENTTNVEIRQGTFDHYHEPEVIRIRDTEFAGADGADVDLATDLSGRLYGILSAKGWASIDGRALYSFERRPEFVPFPDEQSVEAPRDSDRLHEVSDRSEEEGLDRSELVGRSNRELHDAFGTAVGGSPRPEDARSDDRVDGGAIAPASPTELFVDAGEADPGPAFERIEGTGSGAYRVVDDGGDHPPPSGHAVYEVEVPAGSYAIWGRIRVTRADADSLWMHVDGRDWVDWNRMDPGRTWTWDRVGTWDDDGDDRRFELSAGTHEVAFANDVAGIDLDAVYLTNAHRRPFGPPRYD